MGPWNCECFEEHIGLYLDGAWRGPITADAEAHLQVCEQCQESLRLSRMAASLMRRDDAYDLPREQEDELVSNVLGRHSESGTHTTTSPKAMVVFATAFAAAACVALVISMSTSTRKNEAVPAASLPVDASVAVVNEPTIEQKVESNINSSHLVVRDGVQLWLSANAQLVRKTVVDDLDVFRLESGRIVVSIDNHPKGYRFVVETPDGFVEAKGTVFAVEVGQHKQVTRVIRGVVEVGQGTSSSSANAKAFLVNAGELGAVGASSSVKAEIPQMVEDLCLMSDCEISGAKDQLLHSLKETIAAADRERGPLGDDSSAKRERPRKSVKGNSFEQERSDLNTDEDEALLQPAPLTPEGLLAEAMKHRASQDWKGAESSYRELLRNYPASKAAWRARVSLGQLYLTKLKRTAEAAEEFEAYLAKNPKGLLAEEARLGLVRTHSKSRDSVSVVRASSEYLSQHRRGYGAAEVYFLRGRAFAAVDNCFRAREDFKLIIDWYPTSQYAAKAQAELVLCADTAAK